MIAIEPGTRAALERPYRLGLDLDGVLCDFTRGFLELLAQQTGRTPPPDYRQTSWSQWWEYRKSEVDAAWAETSRDPFWWERLAPLDGDSMSVRTFLTALSSFRERHIYVTFITTRPAPTARAQSLRWLKRQGMSDAQVLIAKSADDKGHLAALCDLDMIVDDHWPNVQAAIQHTAGRTASWLYTQPWNAAEADVTRRVTGLPALWDLIYAGAQLPAPSAGR